MSDEAVHKEDDAMWSETPRRLVVWEGGYDRGGAGCVGVMGREMDHAMLTLRRAIARQQ